MTSLLLIISFIIHVLTLLVVVQLFKQFQELKNSQKRNTIELFDGYLNDIKAENEKLQEELRESSPQQKTDSLDTDSDHKKKEETNIKVDPNEAYTPPIGHDSEESYTPSLQGKILNLHREGIAATDIARMLSCGKTEVMLTIQLHKK